MNKKENRNNHDMRYNAIEYFQLIFSAKRLEIFANCSKSPVNIGEMVVVSVDRGEDMGRVLQKYDLLTPVGPVIGELVRVAEQEDTDQFEQNRVYEDKVLEFCKERVKTRKLDMRLSCCEAQLDRRKIRIYFTADHRMDFRGLVRDLASRFHARIEMRQIGVRDDARKKGGLGPCGRQFCCASHLCKFKTISLKNVRDQNLPQNPYKVSGVCSRLLCCLDYEMEFYRRADKFYPQIGSEVRIGNHNGKVISIDIFNETVLLTMDDDSEKEMDIEDYHRRKKPVKTLKEKQSTPSPKEDKRRKQ